MTKVKKMLPIFFVAMYCAVMIYILFLRSIGRSSPHTYSELLSVNLNLIPFANIYSYITAPIHTMTYTIMTLENILGNVIIFIPAGVFLPLLIKKCRRFKTFILTFILIVVIIELLQLFSTLGMCDIDDVIFNTLGGMLGYRLWKLKPIQRFCVE